nr:TonB-dependent receptor [uncultured Massilia sp.]
MKKLNRRLALAGLLPVFPLAAMAQTASENASAGGTMETMVVTATRRAQAMQDVPQTINVFSEKNLKDTGARDFAGLVGSLAGVELRQEQPGQGGVAIRGISELNLMNQYGGTGSATGLYLDELPLSAGGRFPGLGAFDVQRVEVLKGPQGTLFGEGSLAGTVRFIANKPKFDKAAAAWEATGSKTNGGADSQAVNLMVNVPLAARAALRIVAFEREDGGYTDARITDGKTVFRVIDDADYLRSRGGRVMLCVEPTADLALSAVLLVNQSKNGNRPRGPEAGIGSFSIPENQDDKLNAFNVVAEYDAGFASLTASASHYDRKIKADIDQSQTIPTINDALDELRPLAVGLLGVPWVDRATAAHSLHRMDARSDTLELRAVSNEASSLRWTVGAFYKKTETLHTARADLVEPVPNASWAAVTGALTDGAYRIGEAQDVRAESTIKQTALFGEVSKDITPQFQLQAGGRLFRETRDSRTAWESAFAFLSGGLPPGSSGSGASSSLFNPKVTASYKWTPDVLAYATRSKGFRSGGQNEFRPFTPDSPPDYKPETLINNELGLKTSLLQHSLGVNVSVYDMKWNDLQQVIAQGIGGIGKALGNVGSAHSRGVDLDLRWLPTRRLELTGAVSLLRARLDNDVVLVPSAGGVTVPAGTPIPGTSKKSLSAGGTYRFPVAGGLNGFLGGRASYHSDTISDLRHYQDHTPGATTVDLRTGIEGKKWQVYLFADNALNRHTPVREDFDGPDSLTQQRNFFWSRPRTIGVTLRGDL